MVVPIEVAELFKLNKFTEDIKWLIYEKLWKHLYCIKNEMKNELLSKANLINCICKFKTIFKPDEHFRYVEVIEDLSINVVNYTSYLDAFLYYLFVIHNEDNDKDDYNFACVCSILDMEENDFSIYVCLKLDGYSTSDKMYILEHKWNTLTLDQQLCFYDTIDENQTISFINTNFL